MTIFPLAVETLRQGLRGGLEDLGDLAGDVNKLFLFHGSSNHLDATRRAFNSLWIV